MLCVIAMAASWSWAPLPVTFRWFCRRSCVLVLRTINSLLSKIPICRLTPASVWPRRSAALRCVASCIDIRHSNIRNCAMPIPSCSCRAWSVCRSIRSATCSKSGMSRDVVSIVTNSYFTCYVIVCKRDSYRCMYCWYRSCHCSRLRA